MTKSTKIILLIAGTGIVGFAAWYFLRKKSAGPSSDSSKGTDAITSGSWKRGDPTSSTDTGDEINKYHVWGYARDNASNGANPAPYPKIKVFTPDGKQYGDEYTGDAKGVYNLWIPSEDYVVDISADGYQNYTNPARVISNGYRLFMRKIGE